MDFISIEMLSEQLNQRGQGAAHDQERQEDAQQPGGQVAFMFLFCLDGHAILLKPNIIPVSGELNAV